MVVVQRTGEGIFRLQFSASPRGLTRDPHAAASFQLFRIMHMRKTSTSGEEGIFVVGQEDARFSFNFDRECFRDFRCDSVDLGYPFPSPGSPNGAIPSLCRASGGGWLCSSSSNVRTAT